MIRLIFCAKADKNRGSARHQSIASHKSPILIMINQL